jgi:hypothetical protein
MCAHVLRVKNVCVSLYGDVHPCHFQSYGRLDVVVPQFDEGERDGPCLDGVPASDVVHATAYVRQHGVLNPTHSWSHVIQGCTHLSDIDLEKLGEDFTQPYKEASVYSVFKERREGPNMHMLAWVSLLCMYLSGHCLKLFPCKQPLTPAL